MPSKEPALARSIASDDDLAPAPLDPTWIVEGTPLARARPLSLSDDGTISASLWDCSGGPARFEWHYGRDEIIHILEGEAELTSESGLVITIRRGDMVWFPAGHIVRWYVPEYVKKVALFSSPVSMPRRLAQRIPFARRVVHKLRASRFPI
jgi:uncharacterized cupin superfamily protein